MREWDHGIWTGIGPPTDWGECEETPELLLSIGPPAGPGAEDYCKIAIMWTWSTDILRASLFCYLWIDEVFLDVTCGDDVALRGWQAYSRTFSTKASSVTSLCGNAKEQNQVNTAESLKAARLYELVWRTLPEQKKNCDFPNTESTIICQIVDAALQSTNFFFFSTLALWFALSKQFNPHIKPQHSWVVLA